MAALELTGKAILFRFSSCPLILHSGHVYLCSSSFLATKRFVKLTIVEVMSRDSYFLWNILLKYFCRNAFCGYLLSDGLCFFYRWKGTRLAET